jgi:hypothetical protein
MQAGYGPTWIHPSMLAQRERTLFSLARLPHQNAASTVTMFRPKKAPTSIHGAINMRCEVSLDVERPCGLPTRAAPVTRFE